MEDIGQICPRFHRAIEMVGRRWTGAIISALMKGSRRYTELRESVPGLHDRLLSERLRELESDGLVKRRVYPETPVRIEYELTVMGRDLEKVVAEVERWADRWIPARQTPAARASAARR